MWDVKNKRSLRTLEFVKATSGEMPRPWMVSVWSALFIAHPEPTLASDCLTWNFVSMTSSTPTSSCLSWPRSCPHLPTINPYKSVPIYVPLTRLLTVLVKVIMTHGGWGRDSMIMDGKLEQSFEGLPWYFLHTTCPLFPEVGILTSRTTVKPTPNHSSWSSNNYCYSFTICSCCF